MEIPSQIVFEVSDTVAKATKVGIRVEWANRILDHIKEKKIITLYFLKPKC